MKNKLFLPAFFSLLFVVQLQSQTNVHHGELSPNGSLYFRAEPLNNYMMDKQEELYYYIHLQGVENTTSTKKRIPLNLSVVIDRSGSMAGDKLKYTKESVKYLVNQLGNEDVLSIVLYETGVQVFLEPQRIEDKASLLKKIDGIFTAGSTNLEGGIKKGYELNKLAKKITSGEMINRVILLSDGLANVGISDPAALSEITRDFFEKDKISISTFGVGVDYNEDLMAKIAMQGGGKYYFISSPEQLPALFNEELQGISSVVAKNTSVTISFPNDKLSYERTYAYNSKLSGNTLEIQFNDIFIKEQKSILVRFKRKGNNTDPIVIKTQLKYSNSASEPSLIIADSRSSEIKITKDEKEYASGYQRAASEGYVMEISAELYEEAVKLADKEDYKNAEKTVKVALVMLDEHFKNTGENLFLRDFEKKLKDYMGIIKDLKNMDPTARKVSVKYHKQRHYRTVACPSF